MNQRANEIASECETLCRKPSRRGLRWGAQGTSPHAGALRREARSQGRAFLLEHTRLSGCHLGFVDWCHLIYFFIKHLLSTYCATGSGLGPGDPEVPKTSPVSTFGGSVQRRRRTFQQANETLSNSHASREGSETTSNKIKCLRSKIDPPESARGRLRTGRMLAQRQSNSLKVFTRSKRKELTSQGGTLADAVATTGSRSTSLGTRRGCLSGSGDPEATRMRCCFCGTRTT